MDTRFLAPSTRKVHFLLNKSFRVRVEEAEGRRRGRVAVLLYGFYVSCFRYTIILKAAGVDIV